MNTLFEPKIEIPVGAVLPDIFDHTSGQKPPDNFVVCRHRNGVAAATYGDNCWNMSPYHPEEQGFTLNFLYWKTGGPSKAKENLIHETKYLIFLLMWMRAGAPLSLGTLRNYLSVINVMAQYAETNGYEIKDLLRDEKILWKFIETRGSVWLVETIGSLLPLLAKHTDGPHGLEVVGDKLLKAIKARGSQYRATLKQHPPIPTKIYSTIISRLQSELSDWESVATDMLSIAHACGTDASVGRSLSTQRSAHKKTISDFKASPTFPQLANQQCVDYMLGKGGRLDIKSLSSFICEIQVVAKLLVQTFTGMRDDEAVSLPYHCVEQTTADGRRHIVILGRTTKLNNGRAKRTRWVTNEDGLRAIRVAQQIADTIYRVLGVTEKKSITRTNDYPLFVSSKYLALSCGGIPDQNHGTTRFKCGYLGWDRIPLLRRRIEPVIEEQDIQELEQIDPHRAWRSEEKFVIGQPWHLTTHQLRRSLALYAQRSGLVSLPSLRRQLQHITNEMSQYYAKGSAFAKDFIGGDRTHFGREWQEAQSESAALSYILNVLMSDEVLFGGHAHWVDKRMKTPAGTILEERKVTLQKFKRGEIAYQETPLGGCTKVGHCDQPAINWLNVDCLKDNCRNLVVSLPKLERVISAQKTLVKVLDQRSVEFRSETADLNVLIKIQNGIIQQRKSTNK